MAIYYRTKASCLNHFLVSARSPTFETGDSLGHPRGPPKQPYRGSGLGPGLAAPGDRVVGDPSARLVGDPAGTRNLFRHHA
jgi:hypothetical protein